VGALLADSERLDEVRSVLASDDFMIEKHWRIWQRVLELYDAGQPVDTVTVSVALKEADELESVGGLAYLISLDEGVPRLPKPRQVCSDTEDRGGSATNHHVQR
jgi:replicative DNA helicase